MRTVRVCDDFESESEVFEDESAVAEDAVWRGLVGGSLGLPGCKAVVVRRARSSGAICICAGARGNWGKVCTVNEQ